MMSTSRANSKAMKDKPKTLALQPQTKSDGPSNIKPTAEQLRLAEIIKTDDQEKQDTMIRQLMDLTKKSEEACALALYDSRNDANKAVEMLLEGEGDQGEWKEQGKKKKQRLPTQPLPTSKADVSANHITERTDNRGERSRERESGDQGDKSDTLPRRGRRSGGPPPRLARGRGRDRGGFGDRNQEDGDNDKENGFGNREWSGERGRGRGRGVGYTSRRGRGSVGRNYRGAYAQKFDKGPQIDTWTNETAENAEKEVSGWGEKWGEEWADDSWTGSLTETKVFIASSVKTAQDDEISTSPPPMMDSSPLGQRLDVSSLLPKLAENSMDSSYISQYNQQATESIKNSIGIGTGSRQNFSVLQTTTQSLSNTLPSSQPLISHSRVPSSPTSGPPVISCAQLGQQKSKPQKSKLPPPSKIPSSAVEMPGHVMPKLDLQFGDPGTDSAAFSFGGADSPVSANNYASGIPSGGSTVPASNHIGQNAKSMTENTVITSSIMASAAAGNKQALASLDQTSPRSTYQNSGYTTPKKEMQPSLATSTKISPAEPLSYSPSPSEQKSSPLMSSQLASQPGIPLSQGSLPTSSADTSSLTSFVQSSGSFASSNYQGHKSSGNVSSQPYSVTHTTNSQVSSFQNQYQPSQKLYSSTGGQYSSGQSQYQNNQTQFPNSQYPSGQTQYPSYQAGVSFQAPTNASSSLYQPSTAPSAYQSQSSSYIVRDSQPSVSQAGSVGYQNQSAGLPSPTSQTQSGYASQTYSSSGQQSSLQASSVTGSKLGESMTKMTLKESGLDSHPTSQYDHSSTSTTTSSNHTTSTGPLSTGTTTVIATSISSVVSNSSTTRGSSSSLSTSNISSSSLTSPSLSGSTSSSTKAPPNLPPGVPLMGTAPYILGQTQLPPFYGMQQPLYGYDEIMLQQRLPLTGNYFDMSGFPVPTTMTGRDQTSMANVSYSGSTDSSKMNRVDVQSPNPTSQQQSTHNAHQQPSSYLPYGYYYPSLMMPAGAAPGFQYPQVYQMPSVTSNPHAGSTAPPPFPKSYSHGYSGKGYDDLTQGQDFSKASYGASQAQNKGSVGTRSGSAADLAAASYGKSHPQAFEKQGFHGGTPPPFNLPIAAATQPGPMGAPTNPYSYVPIMTHPPHSQMGMHHPMQQSLDFN